MFKGQEVADYLDDILAAIADVAGNLGVTRLHFFG